MGAQQSQMQLEENKISASTKQSVLMFRDQIGTLLSQVERLLFSLGGLEEHEFKFDGFNRDKLRELHPEFIAYKLCLSYECLSDFYDRLRSKSVSPDLLTNVIPSAFQHEAAILQDRFEMLSHIQKQDPTAILLRNVLNGLIKQDYKAMDGQMADTLRALLPDEKPTQESLAVDQTALFRQVNLIHKHQKENDEYFKKNQNRELPDSAFEPATRDSSRLNGTGSTYLDTRPQYATNHVHRYQASCACSKHNHCRRC